MAEPRRADHEHDERQLVCGVCRARFSVPPPERGELMAGFTGPELAALLDGHKQRLLQELASAGAYLQLVWRLIALVRLDPGLGIH